MRLVLAIACALLAGGGSLLTAQTSEIGPGDSVDVVVLGQAELTGQFKVDSEGMLDYPMLGPVKASGMTSEEFARKLKTLLADGYLQKPDVSVSIAEFWSRRVFVTGHVGKPGAYSLKGDRTLLTLLADVGGATDDAGHEAIIVRPPEADETEVASVVDEAGSEEVPEDAVQEEEGPKLPKRNLYPNEVPGSEVLAVPLEELLSGNPEKNLVLQPGDTVFFPRAANIYVTGHVARPGAFRYQPRTTVFQAINMAGGLTSRGSKKVRVIRIVDGIQKEFRIEMTEPILPEDTIVVPERFF